MIKQKIFLRHVNTMDVFLKVDMTTKCSNGRYSFFGMYRNFGQTSGAVGYSLGVHCDAEIAPSVLKRDWLYILGRDIPKREDEWKKFTSLREIKEVLMQTVYKGE